MNILIAGAWPYANGSLHIGHIAALLPGDILARYFRLKGENVCYVSGSDCHGTPIQIRASKEGVSPNEIADRFHNEFKECFERLGFSYDLYNKTSDEYHIDFVQGFFKRLLESGYIYKKTELQAYCSRCDQFLPDRFVVGVCPSCNSVARGDQCDICSDLLEPSTLKEPKCTICGETPEFKASEHFYLSLSSFEEFIREYIDSSTGWRENAINLSKRYVDEGLRDRAITRDLKWGVQVPLEGFEDKRIYVWVEAVLGYLSASKKYSEERGLNWEELWSDTALHYYVHGKDNIPFHSIILPALLKAHGNLHLPDRIISSEYLTLEGKKISTSQNWAVWVLDLLSRYQSDTLRYFFIGNGPEKRDGDFSFRELINSHNGELLGAYGNFVNRTLVFIQKSFEGKVPDGKLDKSIENQLIRLYENIGRLIEEGSFKEALESIFLFIRSANKYFDEKQPWLTVKSDISNCKDTVYTCVQIIANLSVLLEPFLPFSSAEVHNMLKIKDIKWEFFEVDSNTEIENVKVLFERIEKSRIEEEVYRLKK